MATVGPTVQRFIVKFVRTSCMRMQVLCNDSKNEPSPLKVKRIPQSSVCSSCRCMRPVDEDHSMSTEYWWNYHFRFIKKSQKTSRRLCWWINSLFRTMLCFQVNSSLFCVNLPIKFPQYLFVLLSFVKIWNFTLWACVKPLEGALSLQSSWNGSQKSRRIPLNAESTVT